MQKEINELREIVSRLETKYKDDNRKFTLDGHLLGSLGEVYAKDEFHLKLFPNSTEAHDAKDKDGNLFQIKITQGKKVGIRHEPKNLIVIAINEDGLPETIYKGEGKTVWKLVKDQKSAQKFISINRLRDLNRK
ncbi:hypothetical protein FACS1894195_5430 [Bacteroidia bacterium]|nr:hypothetical protein FACS1894195_5430 [Bacteroidia bacterium]